MNLACNKKALKLLDDLDYLLGGRLSEAKFLTGSCVGKRAWNFQSLRWTTSYRNYAKTAKVTGLSRCTGVPIRYHLRRDILEDPVSRAAEGAAKLPLSP